MAEENRHVKMNLLLLFHTQKFGLRLTKFSPFLWQNVCGTANKPQG
jgi:hypothetical protein